MFWILASLISGLLAALGGWQLGGVPAAMFMATIAMLLAVAVHDITKHRHALFAGTAAIGLAGFYLGGAAVGVPLTLLAFLLLIAAHKFVLKRDIELPIGLAAMLVAGGLGCFFAKGASPSMHGAIATVCSLIGFLTWVGIYDHYIQRTHAIRRNFPIIGWCRYGFELIGDELRQYWFMGNREEHPYNRNTRRYLYRSGKGVNNNAGFGTEEPYREVGKLHLLPSTFPKLDKDTPSTLPQIVIGKNRRHPYICKWPIGVSGMSWGALSEEAVRALSSGAKLADIHMSTGEGGLTPFHLQGVIKRIAGKAQISYALKLALHRATFGIAAKPEKPQGETVGGAKIIVQIAPAKFGFRRFFMDPFVGPQGRGFRKVWSTELDLEKVKKTMENEQCVMIEVKLGQGAKPGQGGKLPKEKITPQLAEWRGIPMDEDCYSPNGWEEYPDFQSFEGFVEMLQDLTGKPVGIKTPVGTDVFFRQLAQHMKETGRGPDFLTIDGGEGGTGAAPVVLVDTVGLPLLHAIPMVDNVLREYGVRDQIALIGSGQIARGDDIIIAMALGLDIVHIARGFLIGGLGCIMAMRCHTNRCPVGITTQDPRLRRGLDPQDKYVKVANLAMVLQREIVMLCKSLGVSNPWQLSRHNVSVVSAPMVEKKLSELYPYTDGTDGARNPELAPAPPATATLHDARGPKLIQITHRQGK